MLNAYSMCQCLFPPLPLTLHPSLSFIVLSVCPLSPCLVSFFPLSHVSSVSRFPLSHVSCTMPYMAPLISAPVIEDRQVVGIHSWHAAGDTGLTLAWLLISSLLHSKSENKQKLMLQQSVVTIYHLLSEIPRNDPKLSANLKLFNIHNTDFRSVEV